MKQILVFFCLLFSMVGLSTCSAGNDINKLRVNNLDTPVGIDQTPRFSWVVTAQERGEYQTAYEIEVVDEQGAEVWISGKVTSADSYQIAYNGKELKSKSAYRWRVRIWYQDDQPSEWSTWHTFETAMLSENDWKARWIKADKTEEKSDAVHVDIAFNNSVPTRFIRMDVQKLGLPVTTEGNKYRLQLSEIKVLDAEGNNLAHGKKVTISPEEKLPASWRAENLTDGNILNTSFLGATTTAQDTQTPSIPCYVEIDLGEEKDVNGVVIYPRFDMPAESDATLCANFPKDFTISVKRNNSSAWHTEYTAKDFPTPAFMVPLNPNLTAFGSSFTLSKPISKARMYASGAGHFELRINGKRVTDHVLEPGESHFPKTVLYATYDVTGLLKEGRNAVIAFVAGAQYHNPKMARYQKLTNDFGPLRFIGQLEVEYADGTTQTFASDESWKYTEKTPYTFCSWYGGEDYDANIATQESLQEGIDSWRNAVLCTEAIGKLTAQYYQPTDVVETWHPVSVKAINNGDYLLDFGQNFAGQYEFTLKGEKGQTIQMWPAELLNAQGSIDQSEIGTPVYDQYTFSGEANGETWGPTLVYHGFRYLLVKGLDKAPATDQFTAKRIRLGVEQTGSFSCSNNLLNKTHTLIVRSIASNLYNSLTDCPHREKLGWLEVPQLLYNSLTYNFDLAAWMPKIAMDTRDSQHDNGYICNVAPGFYQLDDFWGNDPSWGGSTILIPYRSYLTYGDVQTLKDQYQTMKKLMSYYQTRSSGNLVDIKTLGDWGAYDTRTSVKFTINCTYYALAKAMAEIAAIVGQSTDANYYKILANRIQAAINKEFYHSKGYYDNNTQASNAMALYYGIVDSRNRTKVLNSLVQCVKDANYHLTTGEVALKPLFMSLAENGYNDIVYKMATAEDMPSYGYFVRQGATSLPEFWDMRASQNHCMMGHLDEWFYSHLGGIRNEGLAYDSITIEPYFASDLSWVKARMNTVRGVVAVEWEKSDDNNILLNVNVPFGAKASVIVPNIFHVTEKGGGLEDTNGIQGVVQGTEHLCISLSSGSYKFQMNVRTDQIDNNIKGNQNLTSQSLIYNMKGQVVGSGDSSLKNGIYVRRGKKWAHVR